MNKSDFINIIVFSLALAMLIYPGLEKLYLYRQTYILEDLVMAPLAFLGENQTILSNDDKFTRYGTNYNSLDLVRGDDLFIGIKGEFESHSRWVNLSEEQIRIFTEQVSTFRNIAQRIYNGNYSSIIYGPFTDELNLFWLLRTYIFSFKETPSKNELSNLDNYCRIVLPSTEHKCTLCKNIIRIFFREAEACSYFMPDILNYYAKNFYRICRADELTANVLVRETMLVNGFSILDKCENGGTLLTDYNDKGIRLNNILSMLYLSLLIVIISLFRFKLRLATYLLALLISLLLPLSTFNSNFVSDYALNESSYLYANRSMLYAKFPPQIRELEIKHHPANYDGPAIISELGQRYSFIIPRYGDEPLF